jgi:hypothetical protein
VPSHDNEKNNQMNKDAVIKRTKNKQPEKRADDGEYEANL